MTYSPIVAFTYNRPEHTRRMLESLLRNSEAIKSPITIYCDGVRKEEEKEGVIATRQVVRELAPAHTDIIERDENFGLAKSIITGVTESCNRYGRVIVLEDDLILADTTLSYFNRALDTYSEEDTVTHISAYTLPVAAKLPELFFFRETTCWGWATWSRAWKHFEPDPTKLIQQIRRRDLQSEFDVEGTADFCEMLLIQSLGNLDSWAIRWYASSFLVGGLALHPSKSLVSNEGFDGTGVHCNQTNQYDVKLSHQSFGEMPAQIVESRIAIEAVKRFRSSGRTFPQRLKRTIKRQVRPPI